MLCILPREHFASKAGYAIQQSVQGGCMSRERHHGWQVLGAENVEAAFESWGYRRSPLTVAGLEALRLPSHGTQWTW